MKLVLIDRDGVINVEPPGEYVKSPQELIIMPQALEAFALLKEKDFTTVVITNQSVVGRGIITLEQLHSIHDYLRGQVEKHGGAIDDIFFATDTPDKATDRRKPGAGMLMEALEKYHTSAGQTPFIGDAVTDMQAACKAGCQRYLVMTGKGKTTAENMPLSLYPVEICTDILDAARKISALYT